MFVRGEEQPKGGILAESKRGIPILVAGLDVDGLAGIEQLEPRPLRLPGTSRGLAGQIEGRL